MKNNYIVNIDKQTNRIIGQLFLPPEVIADIDRYDDIFICHSDDPSFLNHLNDFIYRDGEAIYSPKSEEELLIEHNLELENQLRCRREDECFSIINRGRLWYNTLTEEQIAELQVWYQAWLDAPNTLQEPIKPNWIK